MTSSALTPPALPPVQNTNYRFTGPSLPNAPAIARHWVVDLLRQSGWAPVAERAELCTSELVTNAHRHTPSPVITVEVSLTAEAVTVSVRDTDPRHAPRARPAWGDASAVSGGGRGLGLVSALADTWAVHCDGGSKTVWFTLKGPPGGSG
ncbi:MULTISPECIES: ATP-binding protein [unclassified Streptomyces]|uniref:ATP-binding protein n=1 Tax=unclassified Streptomyces TaxID=2593676 RepID=UPI00166177B1|nr:MULTISPECIES: ATP-binding protein [unclassified Streptomyces]MBD0707295.1 hypothetical protein [Streptomyces sp. CBMA291]MBD0713783.1 hypothetical protein [Streptomyces sp. CBMA370]